MSSRLDFYEDTKGEWRWRVIAGNGEILSQSSESYKRREDAERGFDLTAEAQVRDENRQNLSSDS